MCYIADCKGTPLETAVSKPVITKTAQILLSSAANKDLRHAAIYLAGIICGGPEAMANTFMDQKPLPEVAKILQSPIEDQLVWDACYLVRNIVDGPFWYFHGLHEAGIIKIIISFLTKGGPKLKSYAVDCMEIIVRKGTEDEIENLVKGEVLDGLVEVLGVKDPDTLKKAIETLDNIMIQYEQQGEPEGVLATFDAVQGVDKMEDLAHNQNPAISKAADEFLKSHLYVAEVPEGYVLKDNGDQQA